MKSLDHRLIISFIDPFETMIELFCSIRDGKFASVKEHLVSYIEDVIKSEDLKLKIHQDEKFHKKLLAFYSAALDLIK